MKLNWNAIAQAVTVTLLLGVAAAVWQTYQQAMRVPALEALIVDLQAHRLKDSEEFREKLADLKTAVAVLDARSRREADASGRSYAPVN